MSKARVGKKVGGALAAPRQDMILLAADKNIEETVDGLLTKRTEALGIRPINYSIISTSHRDPGCLNQSARLLAGYLKTHGHAMVVFDHEGSGREHESRIELEITVETMLRKAGWGDRAATVVIAPELESWVWSPSPHVAACLGWNDGGPSLRKWLVEQEFLAEVGQNKPERPKEAMEAVLRHVKRPRSSATYRAVAEQVSLARCADPAFVKFRATLRAWFPAPEA